MSGEGRQWQGTTDGASWMHRALIVLMGFTPLRVIYFFMYFAIPVYMVANRKGYLSIYHYFRRRLGYGPLRSFFHVIANHAAFGKVVVDRFGAYAGKKFSIEVPDMELYSSLSSRPEGMMQVSSHIGNDEMAGYFLKASKRIYALAFGGEVSSVTENRVKMLSCNDITLVPIADDMSHLVVLNNAQISDAGWPYAHWEVGGDTYSEYHDITIGNTMLKQFLYTSTSAQFAGDTIRAGRKTIYGLLGRYSSSYQLSLRSLDDIVELEK